MDKLQVKRYRIATSDSLLLLLLGLIYAWSIFVTPLEAEFGWTRAQTSMAYSIGNGMTTAAGLFAAVLAKKIKPQFVELISGACILVGFLWASNMQSLWELYIAYGILCCGGIGMSYNQVLSTVVLWFQEKSGSVTGAVMMCYGIGSMIFGSVASRMIVTQGWRFTFAATGILCAGVVLVCSLSVCRPSEKEVELLPKAVRNGVNRTVRDYELREVLKDPYFWVFVVRNLFMAAISLTVSGHASPMVQEIGVSATSAALYVGAFSVANGVGRLSFGYFFDRFEQTKVIKSAAFLQLFGTVGMLIAYYFQWNMAVLVFFAVLGLAFGSAPVTSAAFVKGNYGDKNYGLNLSAANLCLLIASYVGPYLSGVLYEINGYVAVLVSLVVYGVITVVFSFLLQKKKTA